MSCAGYGSQTTEDVTHVTINGTLRHIDRCIAGLVAALNACGIETTCSCCGHGIDDGGILLADGRYLVVMRAVRSGEGHDVRRADGSSFRSVRPGWGGIDWHPPLLGFPGDGWETLP